MKIENVEQLEDFLETYENIVEERVLPVARAMLKLRGVKDNDITDDEISIEYGNFQVNYEEYLGCSNYENHNFHIPNEYIFNPDFLKDAEEELRQKKRIESEEKRLRLEKQAAEQKERERQEYLRLREKFG